MMPNDRSPRNGAATCHRTVTGRLPSSVMLREVQDFAKGLEHGFLAVGSRHHQAAAAGVCDLLLQLFQGPGVRGVDFHGFA
jgi:hypothetical protein